MVQNDLNEEDVLLKGRMLDFPDSVVELFEGFLGKPYGGFPEELQKVILKGKKPLEVRPGELLEPVAFENLKEELYKEIGRQVTDFEIVSYALYPKVFMEYIKTDEQYGNISVLDTPTFLYGMRLGEEIEVEIETGKTLIVKLVSIGHPQADGTRVVYFELNGQPREVFIKDDSIKSTVLTRMKADPKNDSHLSATMPGTVVKVVVEKGEKVERGDHLMINEAMKMETTVQAPFSGTVKDIYVSSGDAILTGDLLLELTKA
jgi:pyruvate carboxylase